MNNQQRKQRIADQLIGYSDRNADALKAIAWFERQAFNHNIFKASVAENPTWQYDESTSTLMCETKPNPVVVVALINGYRHLDQ